LLNGSHGRQEPLPGFTTERFQLFQDSLAEDIHEIAQRIGSIDIFSYSQLFYRKYDNHKHDNHKSDNRSIVRLSKQLSKKDYPIWIKAKARAYKSKSLLPLRRLSSVQGVET